MKREDPYSKMSGRDHPKICEFIEFYGHLDPQFFFLNPGYTTDLTVSGVWQRLYAILHLAQFTEPLLDNQESVKQRWNILVNMR